MTRPAWLKLRTVTLSVLLLAIWLLPALLPQSRSTIRAAGNWSDPVNLSQSAADAEDASIALDSAGRVHVVWSEGGELWHRYLAGAAWSAASRIGRGLSPRLAASPQGPLHLAYVNYADSSSEIYWRYWQQATGWELPTNVSQTPTLSLFPALTVGADGRMVIVWSENDDSSSSTYLAESPDGTMWTAGPVFGSYGAFPAVAFEPGYNLLLVYQEPFDVGFGLDIFARRRVGGTWNAQAYDVSASAIEDSSLPSLVLGSGGTYLAWQEEAPAGPAIWTAKAVGADWTAPEKRSGDQASAPQVLFDGQGLGHLLWTTADRVQHRAWQAPSETWHPIEDVAVSQPGAILVRAVAQDVVHVIWLREVSPGNDDVWYSKQLAPTTPQPTITPTATATVTTPTATPTVTRTPGRFRVYLPLLRK